MEKGLIQIYTGEGHGKSSAALGKAIGVACEGKNVVIINFLKGIRNDEFEFLKRLEPEIRFFRFEKSEEKFELLSPEKQQEEIINIKNGLNFANKVLSTGECSLLILDEVLGLIDNNIISVDDLKKILDSKSDDVSVIMTGKKLDDGMCELADEISQVETMNYKVYQEK